MMLEISFKFHTKQNWEDGILKKKILDKILLLILDWFIEVLFLDKIISWWNLSSWLMSMKMEDFWRP